MQGSTTLFTYNGYTRTGLQYNLGTAMCSLKPNVAYTFTAYVGDYYGNYYYGYTSYRYPQQLGVYMDANGDGTFDASEQIYYSGNYGYSNLYNSISFQIPANGTSGRRRFRVVTSYYYYCYAYGACPTACGASSYNYYGTYLDFDVNAQYVTLNDCGISGIPTPTALFDSYKPQTITATLKNYSANRLTSCTINWSLNGVTQPTIPWTGALDSGLTTTITLKSNITFTPAAPWSLAVSAWTTNPLGTNGTAKGYADGNAANDRFNASIPYIQNDAGFVDANQMIPLRAGSDALYADGGAEEGPLRTEDRIRSAADGQS
jgi:hypothetical protein